MKGCDVLMNHSYLFIELLLGTLATARLLRWRRDESEDLGSPWRNEYGFVCYKEKEQ